MGQASENPQPAPLLNVLRAAPDRLLSRVVPPSSGERFPALDGLRGLAVLSVVVFHVAWFAHPKAQTTLLLGLLAGLGVCTFFVLSAFLLSYPFAKPGAKMDIGRYYWRRFWRIMPAYWLVVGAVAGLAYFQGKPWASDVLLGRALFLSNLREAWFLVPILPLWSLPGEIQFYLLLPLLTVCLCSARRLWCLIALVIAAQWVIGLQPLHWLYRGNWPFLALPFTCGMMVAWATARRQVIPRQLYLIGLVFLGAWVIIQFGLRLMGTQLASVPYSLLIDGRGIIAAGSIALLLYGLTTNVTGRLAQVLAHPALRAVGVCGYGAFLWHWPIFSLLRAHLGLWPYLAVALPVALGAGAFCYLCIEAPIMAWAHRHQPRRTSLTAPDHTPIPSALSGSPVESTAR